MATYSLQSLCINIRGVIQNYVCFCYYFKTDKQRKSKLRIRFIYIYFASLCKISVHSISNCDLYGAFNTIGVAVAGHRRRDVTRHK